MVFSLIGGALASAFGAGATGTAIGSALGGLAGSAISNNYARSRANKAQKQSLSKLRISAERAGFNPLTALEATGGQGFGPTAAHTAPLASSHAIMNSVRGVESVLSGDAEIDRAHKKASTALMEAELAEMAEGGFGKRVRQKSSSGPSERLSFPVGASITRDELLKESKFTRLRDEGMKGAYARDENTLPLPTGGYMEELHGEWVGGAYGLLRAPLAGGWSMGNYIASEKEKQQGSGPVMRLGGERFQLRNPMSSRTFDPFRGYSN